MTSFLSKEKRNSSRQSILALAQHRHGDPHQFLSLHSYSAQKKVIRLWRPGAQEIFLELFGKIIPAKKRGTKGLFEVFVSQNTSFQDYRIYHQSGLLAYDPYAFSPVSGEQDLYLFRKGVHYKVYSFLGAHPIIHQGISGVVFSVWAPNAKSVSLVADFNHWDGRLCPMRNLQASGIWEIFIPGISGFEKYKFEIHTQENTVLVKTDPFAFFNELRPKNASIVFDVNKFSWKDQAWIEKRAKRISRAPMNIYELHLGSWKKKDSSFCNFRELAPEVAAYCKEMGFTHIELLPIMEHPLDESWGYQVTGFYSVTSRYGTPEDFQYFVDFLHQANIGVFLDWVPAHFPADEFSLSRFDGTALYEHEDPKKGFHPHWNTKIFNYGRLEVANFLIGSALFFFDKMHIDGLRVDAVASMLYLDYGRKEGEWIPNIYGGNHNLEAIEFLKHLNSVIHQYFPGAITIAEESSAFSGVSHPLDQGGLGFDMKWNMGWMNDTLRYFQKDPIFRPFHQNELTFSMLYAFSERFALVLSHDEVVHGKRSLLYKMPGDEWQRFANLRLLYGYMISHPGKKLLFMGNEIAQGSEWNCKEEIRWYLLQYPFHQGVKECVKALNHLYRSRSAFWEYEEDWRGFSWVDFSDHKNCVVSFLRKSSSEQLLCIHNFTPTFHPSYFLSLPGISSAKELFNSDEGRFGGSGKINSQISLVKDDSKKVSGLTFALPPLATIIVEVK